MSASIDKSEVDKVNDRQRSLQVIKETVEEMGGTVKIDWQTEIVSIDGPLPQMAYATAVEAALAKIDTRETYDLENGEEVVFVANSDDPLH